MGTCIACHWYFISKSRLLYSPFVVLPGLLGSWVILLLVRILRNEA
jgi:hypothetical protein